MLVTKENANFQLFKMVNSIFILLKFYEIIIYNK